MILLRATAILLAIAAFPAGATAQFYPLPSTSNASAPYPPDNDRPPLSIEPQQPENDQVNTVPDNPSVVRSEALPPPCQARPGLRQVPLLGPLLTPFDPNASGPPQRPAEIQPQQTNPGQQAYPQPGYQPQAPVRQGNLQQNYPPQSYPQQGNPYQPNARPPADISTDQPAATVASLPPDDQPEEGDPKELPENLRKQLVDYRTTEPVGTLIIDTPNTYLYLVMPNGKALRYGIGVGREGFTWAGRERISKMSEWPDWHPPAEMIERQPYLPRFMAGGPGNPLGARALYLGKTLYRIHGTNQPSTIGSFVSSGCIRLLNEDIEDLYGRVNVGTRVVVLPGGKPASEPETAAQFTPLPQTSPVTAR
jgi:lipoprotein-anchoring transpeptidase ErfK/SrfK